MPIEVFWLVPDKLVGARYSGDITREDLSEAMVKIVGMIEATDTPIVHSLVDNTDVENFPSDIRTLRDTTQPLMSHPRYGWLVVYGRNDALTRFALHFTASLFKVRLRVFDDREQAVHFLKDVDSTLVDATI